MTVCESVALLYASHPVLCQSSCFMPVILFYASHPERSEGSQSNHPPIKTGYFLKTARAETPSDHPVSGGYLLGPDTLHYWAHKVVQPAAY